MQPAEWSHRGILRNRENQRVFPHGRERERRGPAIGSPLHKSGVMRWPLVSCLSDTSGRSTRNVACARRGGGGPPTGSGLGCGIHHGANCGEQRAGGEGLFE